jgi:hypothetical protein
MTQLSTSTLTATLTLTVGVPASTPAYTYQVRITGTSGAKTHIVTVSVLVSAAKQPVHQQPEQTVLGLPVAEFYMVIIALVIVAVTFSVIVLRIRRKVKA